MRKLVIVFSLLFLFISFVYGQASPFSIVQEKLDGISGEEQQVIEGLFKLLQDIEIIERQRITIEQEIGKINSEIEVLGTEIAAEEIVYMKKQAGMGQVLKSYQKMGPSSYLEIILNSDNMSSFLRRINILRDLTRDTAKLMEQLEVSQEKLLDRKGELAESLALLRDKQKQSSEVLERHDQLKRDMEEYLASLEGEKKYYQDNLDDMYNAWYELKSVFSDTAKEFSQIIQGNTLTPDALKTTFSVLGIKGSIDETTFNDIALKQTNLEKMIIDFQPGRIEIELPEKNLILSGIFIAEEGHILKFVADKGTFYEMPLEPGSIEELFRENQLALDLKPLLGSSILQSVEIQEDNLELLIKFNLFQN